MLRFVPVDQGTGFGGVGLITLTEALLKRSQVADGKFKKNTKIFSQDLKVIRKLQLKFILAAIILKYLSQDSGPIDY